MHGYVGVKNYPRGVSAAPPVFWLYDELGVYPDASSSVSAKLGSRSVYLVFNKYSFFLELVRRRRLGFFDKVIPARVFYEKILGDLAGCRRVRVWSLDAVCRPSTVSMYLSRMGRVVERRVSRRDGVTRFEAVVEDPDIPVIASYVVHGVCYYRYLGYGSVNARCLEP